MLLGGIRYLLPVIETAHSQGYYVITADYLPDNIAHQFSDEYVNVSIVDKQSVLKIAREKQIDGIMSFGVDPGVVTAAYVADQMELPSVGPFSSIEILQNKDKFRGFLADNGFNVPKAITLSRDTIKQLPAIDYPVIVKPTDSAGSKGVTRVNNDQEIQQAIDHALSYSISGRIIIESFIEKKGCSSDSDCFVIDGRIIFFSASSQRFDVNAIGPFVPAAYSWPSTYTDSQIEELISELERLFSLLDIRTGLFNIESRLGTDGKLYIMEASPRGGGNRLSEMIRFATGVDLIKASVDYAVGNLLYPERMMTKPMNNWAEVILHSDNSGSFRGLELSDSLSQFVVDRDLWITEGDFVNAFRGANDAIGTLILHFDEPSVMENIMNNLSKHIKVKVSNNE